MGLIRVLVALYPRRWRASFGEEFAALLGDTRMTPRVVVDVVVTAARLQVSYHRRPLLVLASLLWSGSLERLSVHARLTANLLWAPTTPTRAVALAATVGPWVWFAGAIAVHRFGRNRGDASGSAAR